MIPDAASLHALVLQGLPRWIAPGPELEMAKVADAFGWLDVSYGTRAGRRRDTFGQPGPALVRGLTPAGRRLLQAHGLV